MHKRANFLLKMIAFLLIVITVLSSLLFIGRLLFPIKYTPSVQKYCNKYDIDIYLAASLIKAESNFKSNAVSHANAVGLMQLTKETFEYFESKTEYDGDITKPDDNINAGLWYLSYLLDKYEGNVINAVAAYNAGGANVDSWLKNPKYSKDGKILADIPYGETLRHTRKISRYIYIYRMLYSL